MIPDHTAEILFQPYGANWAPCQVIAFGSSNVAQPTQNMWLYGGFTVPKNYVGSGLFILVWTASVISGNVYWVLHYDVIGGDDVESLDDATPGGDVQTVDVAPGAAHRRLEVSLPYASGSAADFSPDDEVKFELIRVGADAADTMAGQALLLNAFFQYSDV